MILYINTIDKENIKVAIKDKGKIIAKARAKAPRKQAEKLLLLVNKILNKQDLKLSDISEIEVENSGGSFTSLRIGVITANALAYALGIAVSGVNGGDIKKDGINIAKPVYDREPV